MDESAFHVRLDTIERRQSRIIRLLLVGYILAGTWLLVEEVAAVTAWTAIGSLTALALVGLMVGMYRRRQARQ